MPCLCPTNTLKLFIRSLAHIDVIKSGSIHPSGRQTSVRAFTSFQTHPQAYKKSVRATQPQHLSFEQYSTEAWDKTQEKEQWPQGSTVGEERHSSTDNGKSVFAELTPESIEAMATEIKSQIPFREQSIQVIKPKRDFKKDGYTDSLDGPSKTTFRRTKVQNTSLAIHFSAPRAPLNTRPTRDRYPEASTKSDSRTYSNTISRPNSRSVFTKEREKPTRDDDDWKPPPRENWQTDKAALKAKFPEGWNPQKRLSPDALAGIRALHAQMPEQYTTSALAESFQVSPDAIRRILKSKWSPDADEETDRQRRWLNRGKKIYGIHADKGQKPPKKWRQMGIGDGKPEWMLKKQGRTPLPALITTARKREQRELEAESRSLADRIL